MRKYVILFIATMLAAGCSSAIETAKLARTQNILVETPHADGAKCTITDARGRSWRVRTTPGNVAVLDGHAPLQLICTKKGFRTTTLAVSEQKEELLTIDGKRVTMSPYDQFPTKAPRLIPTALKEASSFVLDPTGNISTKYPNQITVWMEPERWESEDAMREWAYEREVWQNGVQIAEEDAKDVDDARKEVRRDKQHARSEKYKKWASKAKDIGEKAIDADTYFGYAKKGTGWVMNTADKTVDGTMDVGGIVAERSTDITGNAIEKITPRDAIANAGGRVKEYQKTFLPDSGDGRNIEEDPDYKPEFKKDLYDVPSSEGVKK